MRKYTRAIEIYATLALTAGADLYWISKQLGHTNITTTLKHYARFQTAVDQRNLNLLDNYAGHANHATIAAQQQPGGQPLSGMPDAHDDDAVRGLPPRGTPERTAIEREALERGLDFLRMSEGRISEALYATRQHFRTRFLNDGWTHPHRDATHLERIVECEWARLILNHVASRG